MLLFFLYSLCERLCYLYDIMGKNLKELQCQNLRISEYVYEILRGSTTQSGRKKFTWIGTVVGLPILMFPLSFWSLTSVHCFLFPWYQHLLFFYCKPFSAETVERSFWTCVTVRRALPLNRCVLTANHDNCRDEDHSLLCDKRWLFSRGFFFFFFNSERISGSAMT